MARRARFEIVRTDAGWHARFIAANGKTVWTTEVYQRRLKAMHAIGLIASGPVVKRSHGFEVAVPWNVAPETGLLEVREVDERGAR